jgi:hypothetical protein
MKAYWGVKVQLPFFDLGAKRRWVVSFTPRMKCQRHVVFPSGHHPSTNHAQCLNELCFWTLSIVWCLKNKQNWGVKNIDKISQYTRPQKSHKGQLLTTELLVFQGCVWVCVCLVCMQYLCFLGFLWAVKCAVAGSLTATGVWLASRVYVCVRPGKLLSG